MSEIVLHHVWACHALLVWIHRLIANHVGTALHLHLLVEHHPLIALRLHVAHVLRSHLRIHRVLLNNRIHVHHLRTRAGLLGLILRSRILSEVSDFGLLNHAPKSIDIAILVIGDEAVVRLLVGHVKKNENLHVAL